MIVEESKEVEGSKKAEKVNYELIVNQQVSLKPWIALLNDPNSKIS
jgi:hypothetical protein